MQIENLTEDSVKVLEDKVAELKDTNPEIVSKVYEMGGKAETEQVSNTKIFEKLELIERQLSLIFDGHVLINGNFRKLPEKM